MKNSWQIISLLLAVAVAVLTFKMSAQESIEAVAVDSESAVIENIMTRSSVRSYTDQKIESEKIETMLRAGMAAPTAGNKQPWEFIVVDQREILDAFPPIIKGARMAANAQLAIVVAGIPAKSPMPEFWIQDCSAATENILLAAHAIGLGAVWCGAYPDNSEGRVAKMQELLNLPEGTIALNVIVIGFPNSEPKVKDKWDPAKVHYNKF
ncbi:MAG: nitroreductase family protein [Rikenellaceae bacterium]